MKTKLTIKTGEAIFLIHYMHDMNRKDLCNLSQLRELVLDYPRIERVQRFFTDKFVRISKKDLKAMLDKVGLETDFLQYL